MSQTKQLSTILGIPASTVYFVRPMDVISRYILVTEFSKMKSDFKTKILNNKLRKQQCKKWGEREWWIWWNDNRMNTFWVLNCWMQTWGQIAFLDIFQLSTKEMEEKN